MYFQFKGIYQKEGWLTPAYVGISQDGYITSISNKLPVNELYIEKIDGFALAGFPNTHCHAFQYAMAGIAESHPLHNQRDDFWSWREAMYQLALQINPEQMEAIAAMLYAEMLRLGYTSVVEFHYLHHQHQGSHYENRAEMGERLLKAAQNVGINITLIPVFYQKGGFGKPPTQGQTRFICSNLEEYLRLVEDSDKAIQRYVNAILGVGIHSLRAVEPSLIPEIVKNTKNYDVFHLHIAEQIKEVNDAQKYLGARPVEWLCNHIDLNERFHLIHATHLTKPETQAIALSQATVVLCPTTEGNLGDGFFPLSYYQQYVGKWSIGTDSNISINPLDEIRLADYRERLKTHKRNIFTSQNIRSNGEYALEQVIFTGRKATGLPPSTNFFSVGQPFDAVVWDAHHPLLAVTNQENLVNTILYTADSSALKGTMIRGKWVVKKGVHYKKSEIVKNFQKVILELKNR